jgi:D-alanyl-D-alanine carboxypeptidase (penicillin-binding protein 5/6)
MPAKGEVLTKKLKKYFKSVNLLKKKSSKKKRALFQENLQKDLLYLSFASFLLISTTALYLSTSSQSEETLAANDAQYEEKYYTPIPVLKDNTTLTFPIISAQAALALDLDTMVPLYEKNPDTTFLPASTTKIVTALVAMDFYSDNDVLVVNSEGIDGQKMGLVEGEQISAGSLLDGLLIYSANDAAEVLAANYDGGREAFVQAMNEKANELNLINTHFENPTGFDGGRHFSTARDLIRVAIVAMQNPRFSNIVKQKEKVVASIDGAIKHKLISTNQLLSEVDGVKGVKTGWTENARENLVTYIERDGKRIMIALLGSQDRFGETKELISWIYNNYEWQEVKFTSRTD